jgi:outer membrane protein assembly factor BamB
MREVMAIAALLCGSASAQATGYWPQGRGNMENSAFGNVPVPIDGSPRVVWSFPTAGIVGAPVIDEYNNLYVGSLDGRIFKIDESGNVVWQYQTGGPVTATPCYGVEWDSNGTIYVGSHDGAEKHLSTTHPLPNPRTTFFSIFSVPTFVCFAFLKKQKAQRGTLRRTPPFPSPPPTASLG